MDIPVPVKYKCRTPQGCVDRNLLLGKPVYLSDVAPRRGAWIEIRMKERMLILLEVAPRMGAWIEIHNHYVSTIYIDGRTPQGCVDRNTKAM